MTAGAILYDGPSQIDGAPIICVATGIDGGSLNHKTGPMVQTWILPRDIAPEVAVTTGEDSAVCGSCPLRGVVERQANGETVNRFRGCYVFVGQAPQKIWESWRKGDYSNVGKSHIYDAMQVRFGSYGDPCAVPIEIWNKVAASCAGWTGYSHQWPERRFQSYRALLMASVETEQQQRVAMAMGWRTFRVAVTGELPMAGEFHCPASAEEGYRKTCAQCQACNGKPHGHDVRASVVIWPHGPPAAVKSFYRLVRGDSKQIDHRKAMTAADRVLLERLKADGRSSAKELGARLDRGAQATATRLWHLRQMGLARRVGRGQYEATEASQ
jgi:hypothetical protein